ncbi:hypothetical protein OB920_07750 [Halobacteria archaeon HArc-gm2]|nr:hypothetical protein [Halobacteria archaeon HArc-gm2]
MNPSNKSRRALLRSIGIAMAGTGSIGVASAQSSGEKQAGPPEGADPVDPDEREPAHPDVTLYRVSNEIKQTTNYWTLLTLPESTVYTNVSNADDPNVDTQAANDFIKTLRRKYPVTETSDGEDILIKPSKSGKTNWGKNGGDQSSAGGGTMSTQSSSDSDSLANAARAFHNGLANAHSSGGMETQWRKGGGGAGTRNHHGEMTWFAAQEMGVWDEYRDPIKVEAAEPDYDDGANVPFKFEDSEAEKYFTKVIHSANHYYNPLYNTGYGHTNAANYALQANDRWSSSNPKPALLDAAYSSHYIADLAQPLHTGVELDQALDYIENGAEDSIHYKFANWAAYDIWPDFRSSLSYGDAVDVSGMESDFKKLADDSNGRAYTLWTYLTSNPSQFNLKSEVRKITENALKDSAGHLMGLFYYVQT